MVYTLHEISAQECARDSGGQYPGYIVIHIQYCDSQYVLHQVSKLGLRVIFYASNGQNYMTCTVTQINERNADISTQYVCNISCVIMLNSEMYRSPVANVLRYIARTL